MTTEKHYYYALGRRKSATARVRLYDKGEGNIIINKITAEAYFDNSDKLISHIKQPLKLVDKEKHFNISVLVAGGGPCGQADAIRLGIAKSILEFNEEYKATLKKADMLSRDPREKERKKFGLKGARKKRQFTKR